jgi:Cysteine-rich CWC
MTERRGSSTRPATRYDVLMQTVDRPVAQLACPLCGAPNGCVPARCGSFAAACWCREASFGAELLARVPAGQRGLACICAACAAHDPAARHETPETA